jgi:hypothetical protein
MGKMFSLHAPEMKSFPTARLRWPFYTNQTIIRELHQNDRAKLNSCNQSRTMTYKTVGSACLFNQILHYSAFTIIPSTKRCAVKLKPPVTSHTHTRVKIQALGPLSTLKNQAKSQITSHPLLNC